MKITGLILFCALIQFTAAIGLAEDWPMWRFDASRTAATPEELPPQEPDLIWSRKYSPRENVWDDPLNQDIMSYDKIFEPIVLGKYLFIGFNDRDKIVAIDTETGKEKWQFYVDGPVRLPLAGWKEKIYFTSDDGFLYCVAARTGKLHWKFRGGPSQRKVLGNKRLISSWPARGGVVLQDGVVYFAASIWPFMGTFIYALDAETGQVIWRNEETAAHYIKQPHNSPAFAGVGPQGALVVSGDRLLVPGGRSVPACFNRKTGEFLYYHLAANGKTGGSFVCANHQFFFNYFRDKVTNLYDLEEGHRLINQIGKLPTLTKNVFYFSGKTITARAAGSPDDILWEIEIDAAGDLIHAGSCLYAGGNNLITALSISANGDVPRVLWRKPVKGKVARLLVANGKLFAVTENGQIFAFGEKRQKSQTWSDIKQSWSPSTKVAARAQMLLNQTGILEGYALFYGMTNGDLPAALVQYSNLDLIVIEPNEAKIAKLRQKFDRRGIYGKRLALLPGTAETFPAPPYLASVIIFGKVKAAEINISLLQKIFQATRPYGGKIYLPLRASEQPAVRKLIESAAWPNVVIEQNDDSIILTRQGALPGAANWSHQYGNIANTIKSDDQLVKLPLGLLWFGGNSNIDVLPRHGHGPPEQVVGGRLFIEGMNCLNARDVYTGRVLWKTEFGSLGNYGVYYNESYSDTPLKMTYNQEHIPGANSRGTNYIATEDRIYIIQGITCHVLDVATGKTLDIFLLPKTEIGRKPEWGYIGVTEDNLVAGAGFVPYSAIVSPDAEQLREFIRLSPNKQRSVRDYTNYDNTASRMLVIMNRYSGKVKWSYKARYGFIHNAITAGAGKIFCLDKLPPYYEKKLQRRGLTVPADFNLCALDVNTGEIVWQHEKNIFGSWLSYSREHDILLQATRPSSDMIRGEDGRRMIAYQASDGTVRWDRKMKYRNPPILHGQQIITKDTAFDLLTGEQIVRTNPLTREKIAWTYSRNYGCNYNIASEHLLSFRSAAAGFYDLTGNSGTGNFGGFRSSCTSTLVAANGVLNAPDYTRTCQCAYQNQTSLAFTYMPELEYWTYNSFSWSGKRIVRMGINLNAPGDRKAENGTLWLDIPSVGGPSPKVPVEISPKKCTKIRRHSGFLDGAAPTWVAASGFAGLRKVIVTLAKNSSTDANYTVKLYFAELEGKQPGERVFDVLIQNQKVLENFDIVREAGAVNRAIHRSFSHQKAAQQLKIELVPAENCSNCQPLLCGIEVILENGD